MSYKYILRYYIHPGYQENERIEELLEFCRNSLVDEVMLFFNAEETFIGHITLQQLQPWLTMAKKIKHELSMINVGFSVNPWVTTVHCPRGRRLSENQPFTLMVDSEGRNNGVTVCPSCLKWLDYICELWAVVAKELNPAAIWLEDDFRLHNHEIEGCFCSEHLRLFSEMIGQKKISRKDVADKIFAKGKPHPWRAKWLELNNNIFNNAAQRLHDAVHQASPETCTALMCGSVDISSAEGRNWHNLQDAIGFEPNFMVRPHMGAYTEIWPMLKMPVDARLTIAALKPPVKILPEFESGPRHGAYSKGCNYAAWELRGAASFGASGITINHYDMLGCGTSIDRKFGAMLKKEKPRLEAIGRLGINDKNSQGINILFSSEVAKYLHAKTSGSMSCLYNNTADWAKTMTILGISYCFTDKVQFNKPYVTGGQTLRAFKDEDIERLLANPLLLDGESAAILLERGFGEFIGLKSSEPIDIADAGFSWEQLLEDDKNVYGIKNPRMTVQRAVSLLHKLVPAENCQIKSNIIRFDGAVLFPGSTIFKNKLGGTIAVIPYEIGDTTGIDYFYMGFFSNFRRIFLQNLLRQIAPDGKFILAENDPFQVYRCTINDGEFVGALNSSSDSSCGLTLRLTNCDANEVSVLDSAGKWIKNNDFYLQQNEKDLLLKSHIDVSPLDGCFFKLS